MGILRVLAGLALLALGRKLYWLFVAAIGFVAAMSLANQLMPDVATWVALLIGVGAGLLGAWLARVLQRLAIGLAGTVGGAVFLPDLMVLLGLDLAVPDWLVYLVGAIAGALLVSFLFDWALIILSSTVGAIVIVQVLAFQRPLAGVVVLVIAGAGILTQVRLWRNER